MVFAVWGEEQVRPDGVKNGFAVNQIFKEYGFQDGDNILKINGETPDDVLGINKKLFLRDMNSVTVRHQGGSEEKISIPEDIGTIMWESNVMLPFTPRFKAIIDSVTVNNPAEKAGLLKGDQIVAVDGESITYWNEFTNVVDKGNSLNLTILRNGREEEIEITPNEDKIIGVYPKANVEEIVTVVNKEYTFSESIPLGFSKAYWTLKDYITQFKYVFTKKGATSVGGFIAIGNIFPATWSWQTFWGITAFLSIMLGFMNLLPIPALDGGHVVFTLWEMITGRKPSDKFLEYAQVTGFVLLMGLLLLANGNDVYKWVTGTL
jgi:regulator of sigma E protease